jgi:hypothetical protein
MNDWFVAKTKFEIFQWASGEYLCQEIPDNWVSLTDEQRDEYIQENVCEQFEDDSVGSILSQIKVLAKYADEFFQPQKQMQLSINQRINNDEL